MTNAEKFKEVFGLVGEHFFSDDYHCPFNSKICSDKSCKDDCLVDWWQSEYKGKVSEVTNDAQRSDKELDGITDTAN